MHRRSILPLAILLLASIPALAQNFDATHLGMTQTDFSMPILVQAGDDLNWARADFDDSKWMVVDPKRDLRERFPREPRPEVVWYRLHVKVSPLQTGFALQEIGLSSAFEIFVNGRQILASGSVAPFRPYTWGAHLQASLPREQIATGSLVIALRIHVSKAEWQNQNGAPGLYPTNLFLGDDASLRNGFWVELIGNHLQDWINQLFFLGLGIVALALFAAQRDRTEYLWLFGAGLLRFVSGILGLVFSVINVPLWISVAASVIEPAFHVCLVGLGLSFMRVKWSARVKAVVGVAALLYLIGENGQSRPWAGPMISWFSPMVADALTMPCIQIVFIAIPIVFVLHWRRGNREAGILLIPWLMQTVNFELGEAVFWAGQIPGWRNSVGRFWETVAIYHAGPFMLYLGGCISVLVLISWALILVWRTVLMTREQSRMEGELEAARQVQQLILPQENYAIPGFAVDAVYKPAQQVGGDFFQVLPTPDSGLLLVVGDVAGKGMPAAMLVAVLVGAARTLARFTYDPGEILAELNVRILGRAGGGFSTCLAAHISSDGIVRLANAGHLAPYLDGREIETPGALPLGIAPGQTYETISFTLESDSRLTFYTDGVVEAQKKEGELLGFDRARELSGRPAQQIADAAVEFGQEDDITVITIERLPVPSTTPEPARVPSSAAFASAPLA